MTYKVAFHVLGHVGGERAVRAFMGGFLTAPAFALLASGRMLQLLLLVMITIVNILGWVHRTGKLLNF